MPVRLISSVRGMGVARERQHVDAGAELLDLLLVADAEALLLVDHEQAQVLEVHVAREQAVGADDDVDLAGLDALRHLLRLARGEEARQHLDPHRVGREALAEGLEVLLGQQRGGTSTATCLPSCTALNGPDRHLGLAEAHVAADEAVHRLGLLHVVLHVADGLELVGRLLEREGVLELLLPRWCRRERRRSLEALLVQHHQLQAISATAARTLALVRCQPSPPSRLRVGLSPPV